MTLVDAVALVAGVAASFAVFANRPQILILLPAGHWLLIDVYRFVQGSALAISVVVPARVISYRRMPFRAEWLGILVGTSLIMHWPEALIAPWL